MSDNPTDPEEQYLLGKKYWDGDGVPRDLRKAAYWWAKAADQGHTTAKEILPKCETIITLEEREQREHPKGKLPTGCIVAIVIYVLIMWVIGAVNTCGG